jgi:type I restriction enzyme S subunit
MQSKQALVPKLRFGGFGGDWQISTIKDNLDKVIDYRGKAPPKYDYGIPLITARNVRDGYLDFTADEYIAEDQYESWMCRGIPKANDVLFTTEAPLGNVAIYPEDGYYALGQRIITLQVNSNQCDSLFLFHNLRSSKTQRNIESKSTGSTAKGIKSKVFVLLNIATPSLPEQEKIAAFLTSVDDRIDQLKHKKSLLQDYKKGAMQKLFAQQLRFKDEQGNPYPDWEDSTIGKVGAFYYGKSAPKFSLSDDAPTPCVRYGELYSTYGIIIDRVRSKTNIPPANLKFSKGGEVLVPRVGEDPREFSKCCLLPHANVAIGEMISVYNTDQNPLFYTYYFRTLTKEFARVVEGGNVSNLYFRYLEPIKIGVPTLPEQTKIANFLSSLDQKIEQIDTQITQTQSFKKGLLQQMFV